ncbi:TIGR01777 family oxidoreductase [Amycolatopsis suaedae]|uniref:TIGR01777 family protein n=1 Tax=Amycolatopsis suaedae TaxID=2510978 RepID=A0A4Q7IYT7_9PSEU|nr:TIGR01777 family oxidoreductase [Amycolatopsis suaedae]RZQ59432.1 TIGR01777 family protein [Amycolatopsis suaedae]
MRVLLAGSSGLIGATLARSLTANGHEVRRLVRRETRGPDERNWDPPAGRIEPGAFDGVDAVINVGGAPMGLRWSAARKQMIVDSRVEPTEVLADAVAEHGIPVLVNASAVGFYGDTGSTVVDETAPNGEGFLAGLAARWEAATAPAAKAGARVVLARTGLVISGAGGLLGTLKPLFLLGLGGRLGDGKQFMPWISLTDEVAALEFALTHAKVSGPVNLTAPTPVTNAEFTRAFARALGRPAPWWVPGPALRVALGEQADEMALVSQRAVPEVLRGAGFRFTHTELDAALADEL